MTVSNLELLPAMDALILQDAEHACEACLELVPVLLDVAGN